MLRIGTCLALAVLLLIPAAALAAPPAREQVAQGRRLYREYCATCHGVDGRGDGPMATEMLVPPPNLRLLWKRYGYPLPTNRVAAFIDGRADVRAHGLREMPVWGARLLAGTHGNERQVKDRIAALVAYIESIQTAAQHARK